MSMKQTLRKKRSPYDLLKLVKGSTQTSDPPQLHLEMVKDAQKHLGHQKHAHGPELDIPAHTLDLSEADFNPPLDKVDKNLPPIVPGSPGHPLDESMNNVMPPPIPDPPDANSDPTHDKYFIHQMTRKCLHPAC
ncbi:hypothetical protein EDD15DRAFT_2198373 [Pisolithus albus]|nr:hypothetical protein EDD15DRAFT_2198373 [Pisolithus albus]